MLSRFRVVFGVLFFLLIASCSGGGCSGCSGCAGTTPLPGGFPPDKTVTNAASVRVSRPGLDFLEQNLPTVASKALNAPNGIMTIQIPQIDPPKTDIANLGIGVLKLDPLVCEGGPNPNSNPPRCIAQANVGASVFTIDSVTPNAVRLRATIPLKLDDTPVQAEIRADPLSILPEFGIGTITLRLGYGNGGCNDGRPQVTPYPLPLTVSIPLVAETTQPRTGYTKVDIDNAVIDLSGLNENQVRVCSSCGFATDVCSAITDSNFVKGLVVGPLRSQLESQVRELLRDQLCTAPVATLNPPCPIGSVPNSGNDKCVYTAQPNRCVPMLLGTDAHVDLGGALRSISPGTTGGLDFGLAVGGAMIPAPGQPANGAGRTPNGITLGMLGGALAQPPSKCVNQVALVPPTNIPIPDEISPTVVDPAGTPHVGIALSGRFLDYAFGGVYNSGLLCLGVSTEQFAMLKTGLLSFLIPSLKTLTFEQRDAAAAIATRPQQPPTVKIGGGTDANTDPILMVTLPQLAIDFYVWTFDRFARVFTFTGDFAIPVNLQAGKDGITPAIGEIKISGGKVANADLLMDNPEIVAGAVAGIFGTVSKQLVGTGMSPIDLAGALKSFGLTLEVNGVKKLTKNTDDFVGLFATMAKTPGTAMAEADTTAKLAGKTVFAANMQLGTVDPAKYPELVVDVASPLEGGDRVIEYTWWIDQGTRSGWSTEKHVVIKDAQLLLQGRHVLKVAARVQGQPQSEDTTPAEIPYVIDALAPIAKVSRNGDVEAWDLVSANDALLARWRTDGAAWTEWQPVPAKIDVGRAASIDLEVKDEEGNVAQVMQSLIRGRDDGTLASGSGCNCDAAGKNDRGASSGFLAVTLGALALALIAFRRRGSIKTAGLALASVGAVAATSQGCACGDDGEMLSGCGSDCNQECATGLGKGQPGAYLSVAKKDGVIWAAGYNDAFLSEGEAFLWGDLVVGKYDEEKRAFDWQTVDGIAVREDGSCPSYEPHGWRSGETDSGENVGLWTSMQVTNGGTPIVSYYDATNKRLKLAAKEGDAWRVSVIREQANADVGKYSKMVLRDGKPVIAFLQLEPGNAGRTRAKVVVARALGEEPRAAEDFAFEDASVDEEGPCRATSCGPADACIKSTGVCTKKVQGCNPACGDGKACITIDNKATCADTVSPVETYPRALGAYISLAAGPSGLGIAAYDGYHGNLVALAEGGGKWTRTVLDGETGSRPDKTALDTGDTGIAASLFISGNGDWHVSYVNGIDETLRYITFIQGKVGRSEVVDDGSGVDGKPFPDGKHIVGDDSTIRIDGDTVTVLYSDSTGLTLRKATGTSAGGGTRKWDLRSFPQPKRFVAFPAFVPGEPRIAAWWRETTWTNKTVVGDVSLF